MHCTMINRTKTIRIALFVGVAVLFATSCSKEPSVSPTVLRDPLPASALQEKETEEDYTVTVEMIEAFLQNGSETKGSGMSITPYPSKENPLLYVVNYEDGWKLIPGDSRFGLVLAEGSTGQMDLSTKTKNPAFIQWLENNVEQIEQARSRQLEGRQFEESARVWSLFRAPEEVTLDAEKIAATKGSNELMWVKINYRRNTVNDTLGYVAPLLQTKWGQEHPWNVSMPIVNGARSLTGCAAVAVSQILFYFHNQQNMPTGLYNTVNITGRRDFYEPKGNRLVWYCSPQLSRSGFKVNSSKWGEMPLNNDDATANYKPVSDFMLDVGQRLGLHYSEVDTHKETIDGIYSTAPCKLTGTWESYSFSTPEAVISSLESGSPVIVNAWRPNNGGGHTWVIDGYLMSEVTVTHTYEWWPENMLHGSPAVFEYKTTSELLREHNNMIYQGMLETSEEHYSLRLFDMNWGWDGENDGYATMEPNPYGWQSFTNMVNVQHHLVPSEFRYN